MSRSIINLSLPQELKQEIDEAVKKGLYATRSEFFRDLLRVWKKEQMLKELRESQKEIVFGQGKKLKSLKDLR